MQWKIWCQRCRKVKNGKVFYIGTIIFKAWKTTIQVDVVVWSTIFEKFSKIHTKMKIFWKV